jgi:uncharacterized membrane protein YbaN (DUF454 family)
MDGMGAIRNGWARKAGGWALLAVGIAGCVLPVIPGVPFALAGLIILARDYVWARGALRSTKRWLVRMRRRARAKRAQQEAAARMRAARDEEA